jgi:NADH:ubiquinone oxidoreductase subunit 4 (subunit M)
VTCLGVGLKLAGYAFIDWGELLEISTASIAAVLKCLAAIQIFYRRLISLCKLLK